MAYIIDHCDELNDDDTTHDDSYSLIILLPLESSLMCFSLANSNHN